MYLFGLPFVLFTLKWSTGKVFWQHTTWVQSLHYATLLGWAVLQRSRLGLNMIIIITITKIIMTATIFLESLRTKGLRLINVNIVNYCHKPIKINLLPGFVSTCSSKYPPFLKKSFFILKKQLVQKQLFRGVLRKRCSENLQQIYRRAPMPKRDFNFIEITLRHGCSPAAYFQNNFFKNTFRGLSLSIRSQLTHLSPVSHFYTAWKRHKTFGFLTFSGGIAMWHWTKMGQGKPLKSPFHVTIFAKYLRLKYCFLKPDWFSICSI